MYVCPKIPFGFALTAMLLTVSGCFVGARAHAAPTGVLIMGEIQRIAVADKANPWSRGTLTVSGIDVIIPSNLIIQMPVQRYTLQELFANAPLPCKSVGETGLARADRCFKGNRGGVATIHANRQDSGEVIAGMVEIEKAPELLSGVVTYINYDEGYFRLNGQANDAASGVMIRINDPTTRHTLQKGLGCTTNLGANCSPDERFPVDNENYTAAFVTGVPLCIPSTVVQGKRTTGSDASGFGDPFCPMWARQPDPIIDTVPDEFADRFVPLVLGDSLEAMGSFEVVTDSQGRAVKFFSAHTVKVHSRIMTKPGNPDYIAFEGVEWDMAGFTNQRVRLGVIGFTSLTDSQLDVFAMHVSQTTNQPAEYPLASTVGNQLTINGGEPPFGGSIFSIHFDVDFRVGVRTRGSPCFNLANAQFRGGDAFGGGCPGGGTVDVGENFAILAPIARDVVARSRNKRVYQIGPSKDVVGNDAPNGVYVNPVGIGPPEPVETNLNALQAPYLFTGLPWALDRRLGPLGCGKVAGDCGPSKVRLDPWPWDGGIDPRRDPQNPPTASVPTSTANRVLSYVTGELGLFAPGNILALPTGPSAATPVTPVPAPALKVCQSAQ